MQYLEILIAFSGVILLASLMVTLITQMVVAIFNLRGKNLLWGLKLLVKNVTKPGADDPVDDLLKKIISYPLVARTYHILGKDRIRLAQVIRREEFMQLLDLHTKGEDAEFKSLALVIKNKKANLEAWFDNMTDRMSERFASYSRSISIIAAFVVTLSLQLDSVNLMQVIYVRDDLRQQLVSSSEQFLQHGEEILGRAPVYNAALDSLYTLNPALQMPQAPVFASRMEAEIWLSEQIKTDPQSKQLLEKYRTVVGGMLKSQIGDLSHEILDLNRTLKDLGHGVLTSEYTWDLRDWELQKYPGLLLSIALLSLGAPFWFNMLKNLVNLRSRVMQSEEKERQERQKSRQK